MDGWTIGVLFALLLGAGVVKAVKLMGSNEKAREAGLGLLSKWLFK